MKKDEIKALISKTIEGQGNQIDIGGGLATILYEILDKIDNVPTIPDALCVEVKQDEVNSILQVERQMVYLNAPILEYDNMLYFRVVTENDNIIAPIANAGQMFVSGQIGQIAGVWVNQLSQDLDGSIEAFDAFAIVFGGQGEESKMGLWSYNV